MMRTIGFLAGVCLTIAAFLMVLDTREKQPPETVTETPGDPTSEDFSALVASIAEQVDIKQAESASDAQVPSDPEPVTTDAEPQSGSVDATEDATPEEPSAMSAPIVAEDESGTTLPPEQVVTMAGAQAQNSFEASTMELDHQPIDQAETDFDTYLFWSPFRSLWAAQGFADRLTLATQVPVKVVNTGPGKYRAAFRYQDETERLARIERIETITGLKLE